MVKLSLLSSLLKNRVIHFPLRCVISSLRLIDTFLPNSLFSASIISFCVSSVHVSLIRKGLIAALLTAHFEPCKMQVLWEHVGVFYERWTDGLTVQDKSPEWECRCAYVLHEPAFEEGLSVQWPGMWWVLSRQPQAHAAAALSSLPSWVACVQ